MNYFATDKESQRKALVYTIIICTVILLLSILISWKNAPFKEPPALDLIEINLGNDMDGWGETQPLIKGERGPSQPAEQSTKQVIAASKSQDKVQPDPIVDKDAAPVNMPSKTPVKSNTESNVSKPVEAKPQQPKATYQGSGKGTGNNETEDNGYKYQGTTPGGKGDYGSPEGDKDSYGNTPGGAKGGPQVMSGNRKIINYYSFTDDLDRATIYARIKVNANGVGTFLGFEKGSTSRSEAYANAIRNHLRKIQFDKSTREDEVVVRFNFTVN